LRASDSGSPMPPVPSAESGSPRPFTKVAGSEPLPGYRLLEPLGRGGFGEVWKCEAPGGLHKAIKFVPGPEAAGTADGEEERRLTQELDAFQQIKAIRHPFLLTLERVELVGGELVMVMELADRQLQDRFRECRTCGLPGIPRDELLAYFADAAEALDMIEARYGLQHLDVKPANLFLVAGHVKVGDFGLVTRLDLGVGGSGSRGLTPKYVAPEALRGEPSNRSDQYSLALVYQELLTGVFPYSGRTPQQIMLQHVSSKPDLSALPPVDQPIVARALAKEPGQRFNSCLAFVQALMSAASGASLPVANMEMRRARVERSMADMNLPTGEELPPSDLLEPTGRPAAEATQNLTLFGGPNRTVPGGGRGVMPKLVPAARRAAASEPPRPTPPPASPHLPAAGDTAMPAVPRFAVVLDPIRSVVPVGRLIGMATEEPHLSPDDFTRAVVEYAAAGAQLPSLPGDLGRTADGAWFCQFPSTVPTAVAPIKLAVIRESWGLTVEQPEPTQVVLKRVVTGGLWGSLSGRRGGGLEVVVRLLPPGRVVGEVTVTGRVFGTPDRDFAAKAQEVLPRLLLDVRRELKNVEDRRKHPRVAAGFGLTLYPIHGDGGIDAPVPARCRDVSLGGLSCVAGRSLPTKYAYATFDGVEPTAGQAILVRFLRVQTVGREYLLAGQYRTDL
jgi:hypothetical protein